MTIVSEIREHRDRAWKSCVIISTYFCAALIGNAIGPSLLELQRRTQASTPQMALVFNCRAGGMLVGVLGCELL